jgi:hypothetical protein
MVMLKGTIRYCSFFYCKIFIIKTTMMKHYWKPTPKKWRRLGDSLLAVATIIAVGGIWQYDSLKEIFTPQELKIMIISSIAFGVVGKFLTNFFKEDEKEPQE